MIAPLRDTAKRLWPTSIRLGEATVSQQLFHNQPLLNALAYRRTKRAIRRRKSVEQTPSDVLDTVLSYQPGWDPYRVKALQHRDELDEFVRFVRANEPESALEIGTFQGGTLWVWARALGDLRYITCIDKPVWNEMIRLRRRELFPTFSEDVQIDVHFGDSHDDSTYEVVANTIGENVDFLFIDGDHSYEGVSQDFETYRRLVGERDYRISRH